MKVPVWRDLTSAAVVTPRAAPRANLPSQDLPPWGKKEPLPCLDFQSAAVVVVVENLSARRAALIWPRTGLGAGFGPSWRLSRVKMCLNLTPAVWKSAARTRDSRPVVHGRVLIYETQADISSAITE